MAIIFLEKQIFWTPTKIENPDKLESRNKTEEINKKETDDVESPVKEPLEKIDKTASKRKELTVKKKVWTRLVN